MKLLTFFVSVHLISNFLLAESKDVLSLKSSSPSDKNKRLVVHLYIRGSSVDTPTEICDGSCEKITFKKLSTKKPIKILIHGWRGHGQCLLFKEVVKPYLDNFDYNIITVDWSSFGSKDLLYPNARKKVPGVAEKFAKVLKGLKTHGVNLEKVHIIGHSLGAHIAGIAGYQVNSGKIGRITGLDPAGPQFSESASRERLSTDSAKFVDVIHSSANLLGFGGPLGHVDFYPNGHSRLQPGCGYDLVGRCSHRRSFYLYAESISKPKAFLAVPCADWEHFRKRKCDMSKVIPMGESTPTTARGIYYLTTNKHSPFGRGIDW